MFERRRRKLKKGTMAVKPGPGFISIEVNFHAKEAGAVFVGSTCPVIASCAPQIPDELAVEILEVAPTKSLVRIAWSTSTERQIEYIIRG